MINLLQRFLCMCGIHNYVMLHVSPEGGVDRKICTVCGQRIRKIKHSGNWMILRDFIPSYFG